jgi:flagellar basal-body rod protein FlgC
MRYILLIVGFLFSSNSLAIDDLMASQRISAQGMQAQNQRLKIISQNIANATSTSTSPEKEPYRRKMPILKGKFDPNLKADVVKLDKIVRDKSDFQLRYEPQHPAADENGYVRYPNVQIPLETVDAKEAQRTYEANMSALEIAKSNQLRLIEAMK